MGMFLNTEMEARCSTIRSLQKPAPLPQSLGPIRGPWQLYTNAAKSRERRSRLHLTPDYPYDIIGTDARLTKSYATLGLAIDPYDADLATVAADTALKHLGTAQVANLREHTQLLPPVPHWLLLPLLPPLLPAVATATASAAATAKAAAAAFASAVTAAKGLLMAASCQLPASCCLLLAVCCKLLTAGC